MPTTTKKKNNALGLHVSSEICQAHSEDGDDVDVAINMDAGGAFMEEFFE